MNEFIEEILKLLQSDMTDQEIEEKLADYHENDIAEVIPLLTEEERNRLFKILGDERTSTVLSYTDNVDEVIDQLDDKRAADLIELMDSDDAVDVLQELEKEDRESILNLMDEEAAEDAKLILSYDEDEIGSKMTTNYITIKQSDNIKSAMKSLVTQASENDNISTLFMIDNEDHFIGAIDLKDLICARSNDDLDSITKKNYPYLYATQKVAECLNDIKEYSEDIIPVLDESDQLIGVITANDVVEVVDEELNEDYSRFAGLTEAEDLQEPVGQSIKKRLPWLLLLVVLGLGISFFLKGFEAVIAAFPVVVFFQSMILDMAGNAGTQSLAVTIRVLSDEEFNSKKILKLIFKELRVSMINALVLGTISFGFIFMYEILTKSVIIEANGFNYQDALTLSFIVFVAVVASMMISGIIGTLIPIFFKKIKIDPAAASGPFITSLNDIVAILCYYGFAMVMFNAYL